MGHALSTVAWVFKVLAIAFVLLTGASWVVGYAYSHGSVVTTRNDSDWSSSAYWLTSSGGSIRFCREIRDLPRRNLTRDQVMARWKPVAIDWRWKRVDSNAGARTVTGGTSVPSLGRRMGFEFLHVTGNQAPGLRSSLEIVIPHWFVTSIVVVPLAIFAARRWRERRRRGFEVQKHRDGSEST